MMTDILLQVVLLLVMATMFLFMYDVPQKFLSKFRYRNTSDLQAKRHFVRGAQFLSQARSSHSDKSVAKSLAKQAEEEADKAISLDPKDAASHILKALSLDLQGFKTSALDSLNIALSPLTAKSLTEKERGDALFKRAELVMGMGMDGRRKSERFDSAIEDLTQAVKLNQENAKAFCLLGECYENKKMNGEAKKAYEEALRLQPDWSLAREALDRLGS